jgi:hypothetical protein
MSGAAAGSGARRAERRLPDGPRAYLLSLLLGGGCGFLLYLGLLGGLGGTGHLPPPALTNNLCLDEKLQDLRDNHAGTTPSLLVVGSSVAWRHFDGDALRRRVPEAVPLNGGFCGLRMNQTERAAAWLLSIYPSARQVVAIASPTDFEDCANAPSALFDPDDARDYVTGRQWWWSSYLRYFAPVALLRNAAGIAAIRRNDPGAEHFRMTRWGDAPLPDTPHPAGLRYPAMAGLDPGCFAALHRMARAVQDGGRRFVLVLNPVHPDWVARHDADGALLGRWRAEAAAALRGTGGTLWDAHGALRLGPAAFYDAIHLVWPAARCFTARLLDATALAPAEREAPPECDDRLAGGG